MFEAITASIQKLGCYSAEDITVFCSKLKQATIQKGDQLLKAGKVCRSFYFLNSGSCRLYSINEAGEESTVNFFITGDWVSDQESFVSQNPSKNNIEAFETCDVYELDVLSIHELIGQRQPFFQLGKLIGQVQPPGYVNDTRSPDKKYEALLQHKPQLVQIFPLKYLASYLRMTPETLSRVRRRVTL